MAVTTEEVQPYMDAVIDTNLDDSAAASVEVALVLNRMSAMGKESH